MMIFIEKSITNIRSNYLKNAHQIRLRTEDLSNKYTIGLSTKMFIMCITLFITTKTNTSYSKVPESLINIEFDNLLPFVDKTITAC